MRHYSVHIRKLGAYLRKDTKNSRKPHPDQPYHLASTLSAALEIALEWTGAEMPEDHTVPKDGLYISNDDLRACIRSIDVRTRISSSGYLIIHSCYERLIQVEPATVAHFYRPTLKDALSLLDGIMGKTWHIPDARGKNKYYVFSRRPGHSGYLHPVVLHR